MIPLKILFFKCLKYYSVEKPKKFRAKSKILLIICQFLSKYHDFLHDTIPSTATSGVGLPELLRPLVPAALDELLNTAQKAEESKSPLPIGSPREPLFSSVSTASIFFFSICTPFLAYRFANVHRNSFQS